MRVLLTVLLALWCAVANAQPAPPTQTTWGAPGAAASAGVGALAVTTSSATISSLYIGNAANVSGWPTAGNAPAQFYVRDLGQTDIAVCIYGGTCTCVENWNGSATTIGTTVQAYGSFGFSPRTGTAYNTPTIVACGGGPDDVEIDQ